MKVYRGRNYLSFSFPDEDIDLHIFLQPTMEVWAGGLAWNVGMDSTPYWVHVRRIA